MAIALKKRHSELTNSRRSNEVARKFRLTRSEVTHYIDEAKSILSESFIATYDSNFIFDFQIYKHSLHKHKAWALFFQSWSFNFRFFFIKLYTFQSFYDHCIGNSFNVSMTFFENSELNFIDVLGSSSSVHVLFSWNFLN